MRGCIDAAVNYLYPVDQSNLVPILSQTALAIRSRVASTIICMANGLGVSGHQEILLYLVGRCCMTRKAHSIPVLKEYEFLLSGTPGEDHCDQCFVRRQLRLR